MEGYGVEMTQIKYPGCAWHACSTYQDCISDDMMAAALKVMGGGTGDQEGEGEREEEDRAGAASHAWKCVQSADSDGTSTLLACDQEGGGARGPSGGI